MGDLNRTPLNPTSRQIALAVSTALASSWAGQASAADQALEEIVVTARKVKENLQDIPQSIQVLAETQIKRGNLVNLEDYARFLPSLSYNTYAPGTAKLIFRGVADEGGASFTAEASAAMYLDEQPLTQNSLTPEPRMVDIERVEALAGPQGTLYGASSQSGTLRIITNKPDTTRFESSVDFTYKDGSDSDSSYDLSGVLNLPLADNKFAVRLVGYSAEDGGYIDNVLQPSPGGTFDNAAFVATNVNSVNWTGGRVAARWLINDNWTATASAIHQTIDAKGTPEHEPNRVGDLEKVRFFSESRDDEWDQIALTIEGDLGFANFVSSTSYFTRDIAYSLDNTDYINYLRNIYSYYSYYVQYAFGPDPVGLGWVDTQQTDRFAQEFRLSGTSDRIDWIAGLFYESLEDGWDFCSKMQDYESTGSFQFWQTYYGAQPGSTGNCFWHSNNKVKNESVAAFGELTYKLNDHWSFTVGGRWFQDDKDRTYYVEQPNNRRSTTDSPQSKTDDFVKKLSVKYHFSDDAMLYALFSEGYRRGGRNIQRPGAVLPADFDPDHLRNYELGLKSQWMGGRMRLNVTGFLMTWDDYQAEVVDPGPLFQVLVANIGDAEIKGVELDLNTLLGDGWEFGLNLASIKAETTTDNVLIGSASGTRLPLSPEFKAATYLQYTIPAMVLGGNMYGRVQYSYTGDSHNAVDCSLELAPGESPVGVCYDIQASYAISDVKLGYEKDNWEVNLFVNNLTDERAEIFIQQLPPAGRTTVNRPREMGVQFSMRWGD